MQQGISKYAKPLILIIGLLCLCTVGITLLNNFSDLDFASLTNNRFLPLAILLQIIASYLFLLAWKLILLYQSNLKLGIPEIIGHIGVTLLGKYIPGKIWGLVGRAYLLKGNGIGFNTSANLLLLDQVLTFYSGILISILFLSFIYLKFWSLGFILAGLYSLIYLKSIYTRITAGLFKIITKTLGQSDEVIENLPAGHIEPAAFYWGFYTYLMHWCATAFALSLFVYPLIADNYLANTVLITAAIPAAMLSGFIALWAPGGIGVRELVIVAILSLRLPLEVASFIAIAYRIICIGIDLILGSMALVYLSKKKSANVS